MICQRDPYTVFATYRWHIRPPQASAQNCRLDHQAIRHYMDHRGGHLPPAAPWAGTNRAVQIHKAFYQSDLTKVGPKGMRCILAHTYEGVLHAPYGIDPSYLNTCSRCMIVRSATPRTDPAQLCSVSRRRPSQFNFSVSAVPYVTRAHCYIPWQPQQMPTLIVKTA